MFWMTIFHHFFTRRTAMNLTPQSYGAWFAFLIARADYVKYDKRAGKAIFLDEDGNSLHPKTPITEPVDFSEEDFELVLDIVSRIKGPPKEVVDKDRGYSLYKLG